MRNYLAAIVMVLSAWSVAHAQIIVGIGDVYVAPSPSRIEGAFDVFIENHGSAVDVRGFEIEVSVENGVDLINAGNPELNPYLLAPASLGPITEFSSTTGGAVDLLVSGTKQLTGKMGLASFEFGIASGAGSNEFFSLSLAFVEVASPTGLLDEVIFKNGFVTTQSPGDYDGDGNVDGSDFLFWQRDSHTAENLILWEQNYGGTSSGLEGVTVPEPISLLLISGPLLVLFAARPAGRKTFD